MTKKESNPNPPVDRPLPPPGPPRIQTFELTKEGKEELALALLLWRDFKSPGKMDMEVTMNMFKLAERLGVKKELENLIPKVPPMKIEPR